MNPQAETLLTTVAETLQLSQENLLREGLKSFLERQLREVKAEIFQITGRYGVASVEEMDAHYREGTLEEEDSWQDFQRLDHLEYQRDQLLSLLKAMA